MSGLWESLPAVAQDLLAALAWLLPVLSGLAFAARYALAAPVGALLSRHRGTALAVVALVALALALVQAIVVQERGLREGSARAASAFEVVVAPPGSPVDVMLATVFLQPSPPGLLPASVIAALQDHEAVAFAAPIALGDSVRSHPVVGTTEAFVRHWLETTGIDASAREALPGFTAYADAYAGARTPFALGDELIPSHGFVDGEAHAHAAMRVIARLPATGTPWDRAVIVPVEATWIAHGLGSGHAATPTASVPIGPPFDVARMPGAPAVALKAASLGQAYALRGEFSGSASMAFFPGEVLGRLHALLGDVASGVARVTLAAATLVVLAITVALVILMRGFAPRFAMLLALGAPRRYVFAIVWSFATLLIVAGSALGTLLGTAAAALVSHLLAERSALALGVSLGSEDLVAIAAFIAIGAALALVPALVAARLEPLRELRG